MKKRESFSSSIAVFFATLSSAVGLGNIWKFPGVVGNNGGGSFLMLYLLCLIIIGIPILLAEFILGSKSKSNALSVSENLGVGKFWKIIGYLGMICGLIIMFFYSSIAGVVYSYIFKPFTSDFSSMTTSGAEMLYNGSTTNPLSMILWQALVIGVVCLIMIAGIRKGIERFTKVLMPILLGMLVILVIISVSLPNAMEGVKFLFSPDFSKITGETVISAMGLAFFKLSLGVGTMLTYASYFKKDINLLKTARNLVIADLIVSLLAGLAIFPAAFSFGFTETGGPSLLFVTIPLVFSKLSLGSIFTMMFFILSAIAATTAMISMLAVPVSIITEKKNVNRKVVTIILGVIVLAFGVLASLSINDNSVLGGVKIFGMKIFDLYDFVSSNILMPVVGILVAILVGYYINQELVKDSLNGQNRLYTNILRYISIPAILIVFVSTLYLALR
ncbi:MAG: sodium-dependent transporter [Acholeplasma sp.]|nr:sodium-dependent transporter [Acholeplasma sp.]